MACKSEESNIFEGAIPWPEVMWLHAGVTSGERPFAQENLELCDLKMHWFEALFSPNSFNIYNTKL